MPAKQQLDKNYIAVMGKIFDVLKYMIDKGPKQEPIAFAQMVKALPLSRTTIHRILYSLEKLGYVEKADLTAHYRFSTKFFEFTGLVEQFSYLRSVCRSIMNDLMGRHLESVNLGVIQNGQVVHIDVIQGRNVLRVAAYPGERNPIHCTALGKAILAFWPESELEAILDKLVLERRTPKTITQKGQLRANLAIVRQRGIAIDAEENLSGVTCIAAPIFNHAGKVVAALSLSGPTSRMIPKLSALKDDLRASTLSATRMIAPLYESEQPLTKKKEGRRSKLPKKRDQARP